jgi:hypothetical protein
VPLFHGHVPQGFGDLALRGDVFGLLHWPTVDTTEPALDSAERVLVALGSAGARDIVAP